MMTYGDVFVSSQLLRKFVCTRLLAPSSPSFVGSSGVEVRVAHVERPRCRGVQVERCQAAQPTPVPSSPLIFERRVDVARIFEASCWLLDDFLS
jgi:hypothetical protein